MEKGEKRKMKKMYLVISMLVLMVIPFHVSAANELDLSLYPTETLEEAFAAESIDLTPEELNKYNEGNSSDKVKIYVFRKNGCGNCKNFLNFIKTTLIPKHGGSFEVVSFELSEEPRNFTPLNKIAEFFNNKPEDGIYATPYVVIGNKTFSGFIDSTKQNQIEEILSSHPSFDVVEKINHGFTNVNDTVTKEFTDKDGKGIKFFSDKALDSEYVLKVAEGKNKNLLLDGYHFISSYDITMYDHKNSEVSLKNGSFKISIPVNETYDSYKVAYINNNQIAEVLDATYENGFVVFTTSHLSEYTIYGVKNTPVSTKTGVNEKNPETYDSNSMYQIIFVMSCIAFVISLGLYKKGKNN